MSKDIYKSKSKHCWL